jgi:DNA-binding NtrC family response regulator
VTVPPLRERHADIAPLVRQFVAELSAKHSVQPPRLGRATALALRSYQWPGNIRELRNVIELVCLLRSGKQVRVVDLPPALRQHAVNQTAAPSPPVASPKLALDLDQDLDQIVHQVLERVLRLENGNRSRAARRLGISLRTVQRHLARRTP